MRICSGKIARSQKGVIYGCEGVGKSTFASKFPKPIFIDLEGGTAQLDVDRVAGITTWEEILSTIDELTADHNGYQTFVLDTADWAERLCVQSLCKKYKKAGIEEFGYGKGYAYLAEEYARMLTKLTALQESGMHVVVLAHSMIRKIELPEETGSYDHYELKCTKNVSPLIKEWADGLLFANYRTYVQANSEGKGKAIGGKERVLYTEHTAFCDAKNRWGLTGVLPLDFSQIANVFSAISSSEENEDKTWGNVDITNPKKADLTLIETAMEFSGISPVELNAYLRGDNKHGKKYIENNQTYEDLSSDIIEKIASEQIWEKLETEITERRAK